MQCPRLLANSTANIAITSAVVIRLTVPWNLPAHIIPGALQCALRTELWFRHLMCVVCFRLEYFSSHPKHCFPSRMSLLINVCLCASVSGCSIPITSQAFLRFAKSLLWMLKTHSTFSALSLNRIIKISVIFCVIDVKIIDTLHDLSLVSRSHCCHSSIIATHAISLLRDLVKSVCDAVWFFFAACGAHLCPRSKYRYRLDDLRETSTSTIFITFTTLSHVQSMTEQWTWECRPGPKAMAEKDWNRERIR